MSDTSTTSPAPTPQSLEDAVAAFTEIWQHDDVIAEIATALECDEALPLARLFRAAGMGDTGEQWLLTHHQFQHDCTCLDTYFTADAGPADGEQPPAAQTFTVFGITSRHGATPSPDVAGILVRTKEFAAKIAAVLAGHSMIAQPVEHDGKTFVHVTDNNAWLLTVEWDGHV